METDEVLPSTRAERLALADLLEGLDRSEWDVDSLCAGWTVHDVAAHLTLATRLSIVSAVIGMIRARGDLNRLLLSSAKEKAAAAPPEEVVRQLREDAGSAKRPPGTTVWDPLVDVIVHAQDIARPLGREHPMELERVVPALAHAWNASFYSAAKRFAGVRFAATDADWRAGEGDVEVEGPAGELLLLVTGRPAGLAKVGGSGREEAARRLAG